MNFIMFLQVVSTFSMLGVIWYVQLVHYPMFLGLSEDQFSKWHHFHSDRTTWIVAPLMIVELITAGLVFFEDRSWQNCVFIIGLTGAMWLLTFFVSVPFHTTLTNVGYSKTVIEQLVVTNWYRTFVYSLKALFLVYIVLRKSEP
jgi:hypothetical protein